MGLWADQSWKKGIVLKSAVNFKLRFYIYITPRSNCHNNYAKGSSRRNTTVVLFYKGKCEFYAFNSRKLI
jgi:hypothetical protein